MGSWREVEELIGIEGGGCACERTEGTSCVFDSWLAGEVGCTIDSGSGCGDCCGLAAWDTSICPVCTARDGGCGSGATGATGGSGAWGTAVAVAAGAIGDGSGRDVDGLSGSGCRRETGGAGEG